MYEERINELKANQAKLTKQIERETLEFGRDIELSRQVVAKWSAGKGHYDWRAIGGVLEHDRNLSATVIDSHSKVVTNWRAACKEVGYPESLAKEHYTPGTPSVKIKLLDGSDS